MQVVMWFLYRRWKFKRYTRDFPKECRVTVLINAPKVNLCGCSKHPVILRDIIRILTA